MLESDYLFGGEESGVMKKRLPVKRVVLNEPAFERVRRRVRSEQSEAGFYMIGLIQGGEALAYDFIEFPYSERSATFVASNPHIAGRVFVVTPPGLRVLGTLHSHPGSTQPSGIDKECWLSWGRCGIYVHVITDYSAEELAAYTVVDSKVVKIDVEVRDLSDSLRSALLVVPLVFRFYYHKDSSPLEIRQALERALLKEVMKAFIPVRVAMEGDRLELRRNVFFYVVTDERLPFAYEFVAEENASFGSVRRTISEALGLPEDVEFFLGDRLVTDDVPVRALAGQVICTKATMMRVLERRLKELIREELAKLKEEIMQELRRITGESRESAQA